MKPKSSAGRKSLYAVLEIIINVALMPLSLYTVSMTLLALSQEYALGLDPAALEELRKTGSFSVARWLLVALFVLLAVSKVLRAFRLTEKGKQHFVVCFVQAGLFLAAAALPLFMGFSLESTGYVSILYAVAIAVGRVVSIIRDHRVRNVVMNLLCLIVLYLAAYSYYFVGILIFVIALGAVLKYTFSRVNLKTLKTIVRKTYALEIVFGLLILMMSFSFLLVNVEDSMTNYWDALWYCFTIVTTIGFGDFAAVTLPGRILSVVLGIYGIIVVALITSIIVNFYGEMKKSRPEDDPGEDAEDGETES